MRFDDDIATWHFEIWKWLLENLGGFSSFKENPFVTPTQEFYPFHPSYEHSYFEDIFNTTNTLMGVKDWPCRQERLEEDVPGAKPPPGVEASWSSDEPAGTFELTDRGAIIRYTPEQANEPMALVATMAHELSHYILATAQSDPPGGWEDHELHTDVAAVFSGFGLFLCNSAFSF